MPDALPPAPFPKGRPIKTCGEPKVEPSLTTARANGRPRARCAATCRKATPLCAAWARFGGRVFSRSGHERRNRPFTAIAALPDRGRHGEPRPRRDALGGG